MRCPCGKRVPFASHQDSNPWSFGNAISGRVLPYGFISELRTHMRKRDGSGHTTTPDANARCVRLHTTPDANARCVRLHTTTPDANAPSVGPCGIERCRIRGTRSAPGGRVGATPCPAVRRRVTCDLLKLLAGVLCTAREYHLQHRLVHVATHLHKARPTHHGPCSSRAASVEGARGAHHGAAAP